MPDWINAMLVDSSGSMKPPASPRPRNSDSRIESPPGREPQQVGLGERASMEPVAKRAAATSSLMNRLQYT